MNSKIEDNKTIRIKINNSNVTVSFVKQTEEVATGSLVSVLSAIYGNRLKQELCLIEK